MRNYSRNFWISLAVLGLVFASAGIASAIQITMVDGEWIQPKPSTLTITNTGNNSNVSWGDPALKYSSLPSSYDFESRIVPFEAPTDGTRFAIGDFTHNNFTIMYPGDYLQTVNLDLELKIGVLPVSAVFNFSHNETPNRDAQNNIKDVNDIVTLVNPQLNPINFSLPGHNYTFTLLGFSQNEGQTIVTEFSTFERQQNIATLYGQIIERPVPEPATMLLLGIGLAGMGFVARRRKK